MKQGVQSLEMVRLAQISYKTTGFVRGLFVRKWHFHTFSFSVPQNAKYHQKVEILQKCEQISILLFWSKMAPKRPKKSLGFCRVGALGPQIAFLGPEIVKI